MVRSTATALSRRNGAEILKGSKMKISISKPRGAKLKPREGVDLILNFFYYY